MIAAVRVPPSAWMTSQSTQIVRSPSFGISTTARRDRPTRCWISCERPLGPLLAGRPGIGGARQHPVLRRDPSLSAALQEGQAP